MACFDSKGDRSRRGEKRFFFPHLNDPRLPRGLVFWHFGPKKDMFGPFWPILARGEPVGRELIFFGFLMVHILGSNLGFLFNWARKKRGKFFFFGDFLVR